MWLGSAWYIWWVVLGIFGSGWGVTYADADYTQPIMKRIKYWVCGRSDTVSDVIARERQIQPRAYRRSALK